MGVGAFMVVVVFGRAVIVDEGVVVGVELWVESIVVGVWEGCSVGLAEL